MKIPNKVAVISRQDMFKELDEGLNQIVSEKEYFQVLRKSMLHIFGPSHTLVIQAIMFSCNKETDRQGEISLDIIIDRTGLRKWEIRNAISNLIQLGVLNRLTEGKRGIGSKYLVNIPKILEHVKAGDQLFKNHRIAPAKKSMPNLGDSMPESQEENEAKSEGMDMAAENGCGYHTNQFETAPELDGCGYHTKDAATTQKVRLPHTFVRLPNTQSNIKKLKKLIYKKEEEGVFFPNEKERNISKECCQTEDQEQKAYSKISAGGDVPKALDFAVSLSDPADEYAEQFLAGYSNAPRANGAALTHGDTTIHYGGSNGDLVAIYRGIKDQLARPFRKLSFGGIKPVQDSLYNMYVESFVAMVLFHEMPTIAFDDLYWSRGWEYYKKNAIGAEKLDDHVIKRFMLGRALGMVAGKYSEDFNIYANTNALETIAEQILTKNLYLQDVLLAIFAWGQDKSRNIGFVLTTATDWAQKRAEHVNDVSILDAIALKSIWVKLGPRVRPGDLTSFVHEKPKAGARWNEIEYLKLTGGMFYVLAVTLHDMEELEITNEELKLMIHNSVILAPFFCETEFQSKEFFYLLHNPDGGLHHILASLRESRWITEERNDWNQIS